MTAALALAVAILLGGPRRRSRLVPAPVRQPHCSGRTPAAGERPARWLRSAGGGADRAVADLLDTALLADLLAACLAAGLLPAEALTVCAELVAAGRQGMVRAAASALAFGSVPEDGWSSWTGPDGAVARVLCRSGATGAAVAAELHRVAARHRAQARTLALTQARRAGVRVVLPLGLCFLPAFVVVGVVPVAIGLLRHA